MRRAANWLALVAWVCAAACAPCLAAQAEDLEPTPSAVNHLPIDEDVNESISRIDKLIERQEWRQVIDLCQKYIVDAPKGVVELRKGIYGTARAWCEAKLRALPAQAKFLYRQLYDPEAEVLYRRAFEERDAAAAFRLVDQFALTTHGPNGMNLLADIRMASGDLDGALRLWTRWMDIIVPESLPEATRRAGAAKAAISAAAAGDVQELERALALFGQRGAALEIGGRTVSRADELRDLASALAGKPAAMAAALAPEGMDFIRWETRFGDRYDARLRNYHGGDARLGHMCHAEVAGGVLYVNTPEGPRAMDALTGRPIWTRRARNYDSDNYYNSFRSYNFYCRVAQAADGSAENMVLVSGGTRLAAHDAQTGKLLWSKTRVSFPKVAVAGPDGAQFVSFSSPALCRGKTVYAMMETTQGEVHLLALDRTDGSLRWSVSTGGCSPASGARVSFPAAIAAEGPDLVFYNGYGVIGKCDAATGDIAWLVPYRRRTSLLQGNFYNLRSPLRYAPIVVSDGIAACMPADGGELVAVQLSDGSVKWSVEVKGAAEFLGGGPGERATPGRLFLGGKEIRCLSAGTGSTLWTWPVPDPPPVLGRVTARGIMAVTSKGLYLIDAVRGELVDCIPLHGMGSEGVTVAVDADSIALVSASRARVLAGKARTRELLEEGRARSLDDPWLATAAARLLQREGRLAEAIEQFARAIQLSKQKGGQPKLAELQREVIAAYEEAYREQWRAGRRVEAFENLLRALRSSGQVPYEYRLAYPAGQPAGDAPPHTLVLASGDHLRGQLQGIDSRILTFATRGELWQVPADAVSRVVLGILPADFTPDGRGDEHLVMTGGDVLGCRVESFGGGALRVRQRVAVPEGLEIKIADVCAIVFNGSSRKVAEDSIYLRLRNGDELSGVLRAFDGSELVLDVAFCGEHRVRVDDIQTIGNRRRMPSAGSGDGPTVHRQPTAPDCGVPVVEEEPGNVEEE